MCFSDRAIFRSFTVALNSRPQVPLVRLGSNDFRGDHWSRVADLKYYRTGRLDVKWITLDGCDLDGRKGANSITPNVRFSALHHLVTAVAAFLGTITKRWHHEQIAHALWQQRCLEVASRLHRVGVGDESLNFRARPCRISFRPAAPSTKRKSR
jgi:hypothetical protein